VYKEQKQNQDLSVNDRTMLDSVRVCGLESLQQRDLYRAAIVGSISRRYLYLRKYGMSGKPEASGTSSQGPSISKKIQDGRHSGRNLKRTLF
jgi:hypothetical protein